MKDLVEQNVDITVQTQAVTAFNLPSNYDGSIATTNKYIGFFVEDAVVRAQNANYEDQYPDNTPARVILRSQVAGKVLNLLGGGTFAANKFLKFTTGGKLIIDGAGDTKTVDSVAISREAGSSNTISEVFLL